MENLKVVNDVSSVGRWLVNNQELLLHYIINLAAAIVILVVGFIASRMISFLVHRVLAAHKVDHTVSDFLANISRYAVIAFALIAALGHVGVQTASIIAVLGAAGLAVGLALQGSLSNLAAGVLLVTFRAFRIGEYVDLGGVAGTVLNIQIFSTTLRTVDGKIVIVPNGKIIANNIINFSREPARRNEFIIGVGYETDIDQVKQIFTDILMAEKRILHDRGIVVRLHQLDASSINFIIRAWSNSGDLQEVYWDVLEKIKKQLDAHNINMPYPQMDVHINPRSNNHN